MMLQDIWIFVFILPLVEGNIILNEGLIKTTGDLKHDINYGKLLDFNKKYGNENKPRKVFERSFREGALKPSNFNKYNLAKRKKRSNNENYTLDDKINFIKVKSNNIINMDNDLMENKAKNVHIRGSADYGVEENDVQYNSNIFNQKHHHLDHFKPGKKSPYTYLHIRPADYKDSETEVYFLGPDEINEDAIRKIIGAGKISEIPHCTKLQYETVEKQDYLSNLNRAEKRKVPRDLYKKLAQEPALAISESVNNLGSKWKLHFQQDCQKDEPIDYINLKNYKENVYDRNSKYLNPLKSNANNNNNANKQVSRIVEKKFQRSVEPIMKRSKEINIPKFIQGAKLITNEDEIKKAIMSQIQDSSRSNDSELNSPVKNGMTKVIVIQTKQKESCPSELGCMSTPKFVHCADSNCHKTTLGLDHFKEIHEGYREDNLVEFNDLYKENPKWTKECSALPNSPPYKRHNMTSAGSTECPSQCMQKDVKREVKNNEYIDSFNPVVIIKKSVDNIDEKGSPVLPFIANFKDESELTFEKGNKKVENKILEGFINSIIANYSKEGGRGTTQDPVENYDKPDDSEAVIRLIKDLTNKRNTEGSDSLNSMTIIIPESSISKYKDYIDYSKLGPFNDAEIKSFLKKNTMN